MAKEVAERVEIIRNSLSITSSLHPVALDLLLHLKNHLSNLHLDTQTQEKGFLNIVLQIEIEKSHWLHISK